MDDGLFQQLQNSPDLYGAFAMTPDGTVVLACGEYLDGYAELHGPVIMNILYDVRAVLNTNPSGVKSQLVRSPSEPLKRITISYADHTLVIARTENLVYVSKLKLQ